MIENFRIRASQCGVLMTTSRSKGDPLSQTAKTLLDEWLIEQIYGVKKNIENKYLTKGKNLESEAIDAYGDFTGTSFIVKNNIRKTDEYFTGECDVLLSDKIVDVKCSWSPFTFPIFETEINKNYYAQAQIYMHLYDKKKFDLCYYLGDTPSELIEYEYKKHIDNNPDTPLELIDFERSMKFSHLPLNKIIKIFNIDFDPDFIDRAVEKYNQCMNYLNERFKNVG